MTVFFRTKLKNNVFITFIFGLTNVQNNYGASVAKNKESFSACDRELWRVTFTFEADQLEQGENEPAA